MKAVPGLLRFLLALLVVEADRLKMWLSLHHIIRFYVDNAFFRGTRREYRRMQRSLRRD